MKAFMTCLATVVWIALVIRTMQDSLRFEVYRALRRGAGNGALGDHVVERAANRG